MSKGNQIPAAMPSFWRWFWTDQGTGRTRGQMVFAVALTLATLAASIPLWYWLTAILGDIISNSPPDPFIGIVFAAPGPVIVLFAVGACRPNDLRSYLATTFAALLAGFLGQAGVAAAAAISVSQGFEVPEVYALGAALTVLFILPALGVFLAAGYHLGFRRVMAREDRMN